MLKIQKLVLSNQGGVKMLQWAAVSGTSNSPKAHRGVEPGPDNFIWLESRTAPQRNTFVFFFFLLLFFVVSGEEYCDGSKVTHASAEEEGHDTHRRWPFWWS